MGLAHAYSTAFRLRSTTSAAERRFNGLLKYADYDADEFATDATKYWMQIEFI